MLKFLLRLFARPSKPSGPPERPRPAAPSPTRADAAAPAVRPRPKPAVGTTLRGRCHVIDGDTIVIDRIHIRLAGIDAPEMDQPYGHKAKWAMVALCKGRTITARCVASDDYDRVVAKCYAPDGVDLSAALVERGLALDWAKYSGGVYRPFEPEGARKRLWRVAAKHRGRYRPGT